MSTSLTTRQILIAMYYQSKGNWMGIYDMILNNKKIFKKYQKYSIKYEKNYITLMDSEYPETIKHLNKPNFIFRYSGDLSKLNNNHVLLLNNNKTLKNHNFCKIINIEPNKDTIERYCVKFSDCDVLLYAMTKEEAIKLAFGYCVRGVIVDFTTARHVLKYLITIIEFKEIYVVPTLRKSFVNEMIKNGCNLYDCEDDLECF